MLPEYFEARERALLGDRFDEIYAPKEAPARGITVNGLRCLPEEFEKLADFSLQPSPFCKEGFVVLEPEFRPGRHPYHHAGVFYSQEPSASAPAALLDVQPGMKVLDLCAAPGGKSSQLAAALKGQGLLVSNEYNAARAEALKSNLERMGAANALVTNADTGVLAKSFPAFFDRVLVDAPCSGEGMFRKEPQALSQHCEALVKQCAALGEEILENAVSMLAPGGLLVFSTCTFAPEEDEEQVARLLDRHPEMTLLPIKAGFGSPGEENRCGGFLLDVEKVRRIWPSQSSEGHFMALLQKSGDAEPAPAPSGKKKKGSQKPEKPDPDWQAFAKTYFPQLQEKSTRKAGEMLLLVPQIPIPEGKYRALRCGVTLGAGRKGRFEPGHHLFMAFGAQCTNTERLTLADERTAAWLRGEEIEARTAQNGWCTVLVDGFPLGAGKVSGGRVKNHYPKALRNLK